MDKYLKADIRERYQFKLVNQDLWTFLYSKYGGSEIKRYSVPLSYYSTQIEVRLKLLAVVILPVSLLLEGGDELNQLDQILNFNLQLSKRKSYSDLKKRIADCINAAQATFAIDHPITENDIRLWKFSDNKERLIEQCKKISDHGKEDS